MAAKTKPLHGTLNGFLKKKQNAPRPSEHPPPVREENMSKRLGEIKGCKNLDTEDTSALVCALLF